MKKIAFICFALLITARAVSAADDGKLQLRRFYLNPLAHADFGEPITARSGTDWKSFFGELGVEWPTGSSAIFDPDLSLLAVKNTRKNILLLEEILGNTQMRNMIDIRIDFVEFKMDDIGLLTREGTFCTKELLAIWKKGQARLLCSPQALTKSGQECIVKGVTEVLYPTEFESVAVISTNGTSTASHPGTVIPTAFEMRECGVVLQVIPEISYEGNLINVMLNPQIISPPVWKNYGATRPNSEGDTGTLPMEMPFFHTQSVSTSVTVANGIPILIGGGMSNRDGDRAVYAFLTARMIDPEGNPFGSRVPEPSK